LLAGIEAGVQCLSAGHSAVDAVEAAVRILEDDPRFNAGRGAVFNEDGTNELDAAIMDGSTLKAGAIAGVTRTKNPISLARAVMERTRHVMLIGAGADAFSRDAGLEQVDPSYFYTEERWRELVAHLGKEGRSVPAGHEFGTVGAVALDQAGNVAAGTSTGGILDKQWGRVGDSPIIGAGTYASNQSGAVSGTGAGEYFIRLTLARDICALLECRGLPLQTAVDYAIKKELTNLGGDGGVIAVTPDGHMAWSFNTSSMFRAQASEGSPPRVCIYEDEA
jgi:beta-aspartyl-peptidase (threonine type)